MALTDPELDLLRELLEDDPTADLYVQVGGELVRRGEWLEARDILIAGLQGGSSVEAHALLARAALELGDFDISLASLEHLDRTPGTEAARLEILALERAGNIDEARERAQDYLQVDPNDVVVNSVIERLDAPPPSMEQRANDPFLTVQRAERYVAVGRVDRAVRTYRRILFRNPGDRGVGLRMRQLMAEEQLGYADDLSEELTDPGLVPPEFTMPTPGLGARADADPSTTTESVPAEDGPGATPAGEPRKKGGKRRRRRSLIRR